MNNHLIKLFFLFLSFSIFSQELPPINNFSIKDYGAESQNWDISQADNKFIYVANNKGLLEFNGATWQLYATPNETILRSVKVIGNTVFTGFYMDFGYWKKNEFNVLEFTSIVKEQNIQMIEDEQVEPIAEPEAPKYVQLEDSKLQALLKQFFNDAINTLYIEIALELKKKTGDEEISLQ